MSITQVNVRSSQGKLKSYVQQPRPKPFNSTVYTIKSNLEEISGIPVIILSISLVRCLRNYNVGFKTILK